MPSQPGCAATSAMPSSSPRIKSALRERLGERRVRRHHQRLAAALERQPAARIEHVAVAAASDQRPLAEAARDRERLIREREHAERALVGTAREQPPARGPGRRAQRPDAALPEVEQRALDSALAQQRQHAVERPALRDAAEVDRDALLRERHARRLDPDLVGADQRPRPRDLARARRHARLPGARPERDQRPHRHVERAPREARVADRRREDPRQLGSTVDRAAPGRAVQPRELARPDRRASAPRPGAPPARTARRASRARPAPPLAYSVISRIVPIAGRPSECSTSGGGGGAAQASSAQRGEQRAASRTLGGVVVVALRAREHRPEREDDERREAPLEQQEARDLGPGERRDARSAPASPSPRRAAPRANGSVISHALVRPGSGTKSIRCVSTSSSMPIAKRWKCATSSMPW